MNPTGTIALANLAIQAESAISKVLDGIILGHKNGNREVKIVQQEGYSPADERSVSVTCLGSEDVGTKKGSFTYTSFAFGNTLVIDAKLSNKTTHAALFQDSFTIRLVCDEKLKTCTLSASGDPAFKDKQYEWIDFNYPDAVAKTVASGLGCVAQNGDFNAAILATRLQSYRIDATLCESGSLGCVRGDTEYEQKLWASAAAPTPD